MEEAAATRDACASIQPARATLAGLGIGRFEVLTLVVVLVFGVHGWQRSSDAALDRSRASFEAESARLLMRVETGFDDLRDALESGLAQAWQDHSTLANIGWTAFLDHLGNTGLQADPGGAALAAALPRDMSSDTRSNSAGSVDTTAPGRPGSALPDAWLRVIRGAGAASGGQRQGADLFSNIDTVASAELARDSGHAVWHRASDPTGPDGAVAASLFAPLYAIDNPWGLRDRRAQFVGLVIVPFDPVRILSQALREHPGLAVSASVGGAALLERHQPPVNVDAQLVPLTASLELLGQTVDFEIAPIDLPGHAAGADEMRLWTLQASLTALMLLLLFLYRAAGVRREGVRLDGVAMTREARIAELESDTTRLESFAYVVSHDLKTPLRTIQGLTEVLAEELEYIERDAAARADADECLDRLRAQSGSMANLIDGIGAYSRARASEERIETIDTRACVEAAAVTNGIPKERIRLTGDFPVIRTSSVRFEQTVANLVGNAWKYHDRQDEAIIDVSVTGFGDYWKFAVRDDGPGIDPAHHARIFEAFEAVRVPGVESSGIGLSIVRTAVHSVGGQLTLESSPGHGSTFRFTWPKGSASVATSDAP